MKKEILLFLILFLPLKETIKNKKKENYQTSSKKYVLLSVDVEAFKPYAKKNHIKHLIYGDFPPYSSAGILNMMEIADEAEAKLTFFVDFCEEGIYGIKPLVQITKDILSRGHGIETHCHPSTLGKKFWKEKLPSKPRKNQTHFDKETSSLVFAKLAQILERVKQELPSSLKEKFKPTSYRAGALRYNDKTLKRIYKDGYKITSNYWNRALKSWSHKGTHKLIGYQLSPFYWTLKGEETLLEIPLHGHFNNPLILEYVALQNPNKNQASYENIINKATRDHDIFWEDMNNFESPLVNLIMHSWSFLCHMSSKKCNEKPNNTKYYTYGKASLIERKKAKLLSLLKNKPKNFEFITFKEFNKKIELGEIKISQSLSLKKAEI